MVELRRVRLVPIRDGGMVWMVPDLVGFRELVLRDSKRDIQGFPWPFPAFTEQKQGVFQSVFTWAALWILTTELTTAPQGELPRRAKALKQQVGMLADDLKEGYTDEDLKEGYTGRLTT